MSTANSSNDLVHATAQIVAAYAGNPSHKLTPTELQSLFGDMHGKITAAAKQDSNAGISAPAAPAALPAPAATSADVAMRSLEGSVVHAGSPEGAIDAEKIWPDATPDQRELFLSLMEKHGIPHGADGRPMPRRPVDKLVEPWQVIDPISGNGFKMLKRHLSVSYGLDINDLRAMFHLPADFPVTAPAYSESKRIQAESSGLGKGPKAKAVKAKTTKAKTTKAPAKAATTRGKAKAAA